MPDSALDQLVAATQDRLAVLGQRRAEGSLDGLAFRGQVQAVLKDSHLAAAAVSKGGFDNLDKSTLGFVGSRLRSEYDHLAVLVLDTNLGEFDGQAMARLAQYGNGAVRGTESAIRRRDAVSAGQDQEMNELGDSASGSCSECEDLSALGWVDAGSLPEIGSRICCGNCNCSIVTRNSSDVAVEA